MSNTNKRSKKDNFILSIILIGLAGILALGVLINVGARSQGEYIPAPEGTSSDFGGIMLSDYDNVKVTLNSNSISFDFPDVSLSHYKLLVLDVVDSYLSVRDSGTNTFGPVFSNETLDLYSTNKYYPGESGALEFSTGGVFSDISAIAYTYSYILDLSDLVHGNVIAYAYLDGIYHKTLTFADVAADTTLNSFTLLYEVTEEMYGDYTVSSLYFYGFESIDDSDYAEVLSDNSLKLTDCKDSMLYQGE